MATKLHGMLNLSRIPKELITTNKAGDKIVWIDCLERLTKGAHGETHSIVIYDKATKSKVYIADLTPQEFGTAAPKQSAPQQNYRQAAPAQEENVDLPF